MSKQRCETCRYYDEVRPRYGLCRHPVVNLLREMVQDNMVPFAFKELEVTTVKPDGGVTCPTWQAHR